MAGGSGLKSFVEDGVDGNIKVGRLTSLNLRDLLLAFEEEGLAMLSAPGGCCIIVCKTADHVPDICDFFWESDNGQYGDCLVAPINGHMPSNQQAKAIARFNRGDSNVLVIDKEALQKLSSDHGLVTTAGGLRRANLLITAGLGLTELEEVSMRALLSRQDGHNPEHHMEHWIWEARKKRKR